MNQEIETLAQEVAVKAARQAGELARERFGGKLDIRHKDSRGDLVTEVDIMADKLIVEEIGRDGADSDWVWHVDPLVGTNNFALGIPLYGVSISLSFRGQIAVGVVHDSALRLTYSAIRGRGARLNDERLGAKPREFGQIHDFVDSRPCHRQGRRPGAEAQAYAGAAAQKSAVRMGAVADLGVCTMNSVEGM